MKVKNVFAGMLGEHAIASLFSIVLLTLVIQGCGKEGGQPRKAPAAGTIVGGVATETVRYAALPETFDASGTVRASTSALVSSRIPGVISMLTVREGDRVKKGQLLARIDARENQAQAAAAVSGAEEARRALDEAIARKRMADTTFERYHRLFNEQAVSRHEFDVRQTEKELAAQGVARAEARLRQAEESSRSAGAMSDYTKITAPVSGIIASKQADLGATVFPAQPLMTIEDEGSYQLELAIPENMAAKVRPGTGATVRIDAVGGDFPAKIADIVPSADPASRTFTAKVKLSRSGIRSGMFGRAAIPAGVTVNSLMVPKKALFERGALTSVWVVGKEGIARMRLVKTGKIHGDKVEVLSGLSDGERVAVSGADKISEGAKVE